VGAPRLASRRLMPHHAWHCACRLQLRATGCAAWPAHRAASHAVKCWCGAGLLPVFCQASAAPWRFTGLHLYFADGPP
ncbi:hypothetical protein HAX54_017171, partial [Datura stramonium]|nr:hypothetical protein [Datura stramonium]